MTRRWTVTLSHSYAFVRGYGSREALVELKRRQPVWSRSERAWSCQPKTARDLIAMAEERGIDLVIQREDGGEA